jgi:hypothetical protein
MGSIFATAISDQLGPGVYGVNVKPAATLVPEGTATSCLVEQFPWGPTGIVYQPVDDADRILTFYPPGMNRNMAGPLALSGKGWPDNRIVRVVASSGTAVATATLASAVPANIVTATLKSVGTAGNVAVATVAASSDGVSGHWKLQVQVTGVSGTTTDVVDNIDSTSATTLANTTAAQLTKCILLGSLAWVANGTPANGTTAFASGADGSVVASDYVGTAGLGDKGLALTEGEDAISLICFGDPGGSLRAACNAGLKAHVLANNRRNGFATGNSGQSASAAQTDVASYRADTLIYVDPWMKQLSDQDSTIQTIPAAALAMSVAAQLSPSTHISWRDPEVADLMASVYDVEAKRGAQAKTNSDQGIVTLIKKSTGGFAFYSDNTSNAPVNTAQPDLATIRIGQYILTSAEAGFQSNVDGPNVPATQRPMRGALDSFMTTMVHNRDHDPAHNPYVKDYSLGDEVASNPQSSLDAGDYVIPLTAKTDRGMLRIFIPITYGPTASP